MRQKKYEICEKQAMEAIIKKGFYCSVAFPSKPYPYLVPMNYGFVQGTIYLHGAKVGERAEILEASKNHCPVTLAFVTHAELSINGENACSLSTNHESVVIKGIASEVTDTEEKIVATNALLQQVGEKERPINEKMLEKTLFIRVKIEEMTGSKRAK